VLPVEVLLAQEEVRGQELRGSSLGLSLRRQAGSGLVVEGKDTSWRGELSHRRPFISTRK